MTLKSCKFDVTGLFEAGQLYVALSRVRDLKNVEVVGNISDVMLEKSAKPNKIAYEFVMYDR